MWGQKDPFAAKNRRTPEGGLTGMMGVARLVGRGPLIRLGSENKRAKIDHLKPGSSWEDMCASPAEPATDKRGEKEGSGTPAKRRGEGDFAYSARSKSQNQT